jgi:hypothetical protein
MWSKSFDPSGFGLMMRRRKVVVFQFIRAASEPHPSAFIAISSVDEIGRAKTWARSTVRTKSRAYVRRESNYGSDS